MLVLSNILNQECYKEVASGRANIASEMFDTKLKSRPFSRFSILGWVGLCRIDEESFYNVMYQVKS